MGEIGTQLSLDRNYSRRHYEPPVKKMWEAALDKAKLYNLHAEAGMGGGRQEGVETKEVHLNQLVTGIKPRIHLFSPLLLCFSIIIREKLLFTRPPHPPTLVFKMLL